MPTIHAEQAVYGSFPFWSRGYALLARSPGCRDEWVRDFEAICQEFGEPCAGASGDGAILCKRLRRGPWLIVRVASQGADDRGRPGALAFHGLFVRAPEFAKIGYDPFLLVDAFRADWSESTVLETLTLSAPEPQERSQQLPLAAYLAHRGVAIESSVPIEEVARVAWRALTVRERRMRSLATLTFRDPRDYSIAATPRISEDVRASYSRIPSEEEALEDIRHLDPAARSALASSKPLHHGQQTAANEGARRHEGRRISWRLAAPGLLLLVVFALFGRWLALRDKATPPPMAERIAPPALTPDDARPVEPDERSRLVEGLIELGERFHVAMPASLDPTSMMREIDRQLRYTGEWLSPEDRARIGRQHPDERGPTLAWDDHMQFFRSDRPLPADFSGRPLREQVALFAWSFRLPPDPKRSAGEVPHALIDALSLDRPIRPSSGRSGSPALAGYERFLSRLPTR